MLHTFVLFLVSLILLFNQASKIITNLNTTGFKRQVHNIHNVYKVVHSICCTYKFTFLLVQLCFLCLHRVVRLLHTDESDSFKLFGIQWKVYHKPSSMHDSFLLSKFYSLHKLEKLRHMDENSRFRISEMYQKMYHNLCCAQDFLFLLIFFPTR